MRFAAIYLLMLMVPSLTRAQELPPVDTSAAVAEKPSGSFSLNGYIKDMQTLSFDKTFNSLAATNLIHNRLNCKWRPAENLTLALELRNRLIWGDEVRSLPDYGKYLRNANERIDLSRVWFSNPSMVLHTNIDRFYADYKLKNVSLRLGRQRINWGIATTWNPNDLFNTYNFLDFDYEERPGSDAVRFTTEFTGFSGLEIAYSPGRSGPGKVLAGKYYFNAKGYDFQLISGIYGDRFTAGTGWAGSIGEAGFKGEFQFFSGSGSDKVQYNLTVESDYVFGNGWYLNGALLFNNNGLNRRITNPLEVNFNFSPSNLMPTKWNFILTTGKEITPLLSTNLSVLYSPGTNLLLILPGIRYSLADNLNADFIWQSFFASLNNFEALSHRGFLRVKLNF